MKKTITSHFTGRLYLFFCVCLISITQSSCLTQIYSPSTTLSMTGTTSYCQGAPATANTLTYDQCTSGTGLIPTGVSYTAQWYVNTTGGTSIPGSTAHGAPISGTSPAGGTGTINYTPSTATAGTFHYFCYVTWGTTGTCTPDYTSSAQTVTITPGPAITGTASVCQGQTTTLSTTATGGAWSSSVPGVATVSGGVVTGVSPGTSTIAYTVGGCAGSVVVTVNALPPAITPATPVSICAAGTASLSNSMSGGTWTTGSAAVATVSSSGVVTGMGGGTTNVTYTITASGCYVTKPVTVNPVPAPLTGPAQVCLGNTITLASSTPGGTWSSSTPGVGTVSTGGVVTGISAGTTTITYSGCGFVTREITVNPLPDPITGTMHVCEAGGTTTLSSTTMGGTWSSGAPTIAAATTTGPGTGLITGGADGTATITYTSPLTCIITAIVTVDPAPDAIVGVVPICAGQSMMLSNPVPGGTWSSSNTFIATVSSGGLVTGVAGGGATIIYTNGCGVATVPITVNPLPAPIDGNDTVCAGGTTALADATLGGTWSSSAPAVASVLLTSGLVSGHFAGPVTITYTMPGGCYVTLPITVVPMPPAITGTLKACPGTTTTLSNPVSGGMWGSGSPSVATVNSMTGAVTGVSAGVADITYTTGPGCQVFTSVIINPLPAPIVGADVVYCAADKDTLYNPTPGGSWSSLTPSIATIDPFSGIMTILLGGTAVIRYTLPTGCGINKSVTINPAPAPTVTYNAATNTFYTETGYASYQWYDSVQGLIPGATTYRTAALYYGQYWVKVTDGNGCAAFSEKIPYNIHSGTVDIAANRDNYFVFPNPSNAAIFIEAPVPVRAVITSIDGKVLVSEYHAKELDISKLADGVYMVLLYDDEGVQRSVHKLIKQ